MSGDLRGTAGTRAAQLPPSRPLGGGALLPGGGRGGRGLAEPSGWRPGSLAPNRAEAPPSAPRLPIFAAAGPSL